MVNVNPPDSSARTQLDMTDKPPSETTDRAEMTDKTRITIAALTTMLLLGAMPVAGALPHTDTPVVAATNQAPSAAISVPHAVPPQTTDQTNND
jgi:hypothetical protein